MKKRPKKRKQTIISRCTMNTTCLIKASMYIKILKDNVENFFKQEKRMTTQNKTAGIINMLLLNLRIIGLNLSVCREQKSKNAYFCQKCQPSSNGRRGKFFKYEMLWKTWNKWCCPNGQPNNWPEELFRQDKGKVWKHPSPIQHH